MSAVSKFWEGLPWPRCTWRGGKWLCNDRPPTTCAEQCQGWSDWHTHHSEAVSYVACM